MERDPRWPVDGAGGARRMQKLILMSVLFLLIAAPVAAARDPRPLFGMRRAFWWSVVGVFCYALAVVFVYPFFVH